MASGKTAQRTVLYWGEINDQQQAAWRKTLEVFVEDERGYSRDGRADCLQPVIALVVTPDGFPLAYEVMKATRRIVRRCPDF